MLWQKKKLWEYLKAHHKEGRESVISEKGKEPVTKCSQGSEYKQNGWITSEDDNLPAIQS
jgi:hypothetical protein